MPDRHRVKPPCFGGKGGVHVELRLKPPSTIFRQKACKHSACFVTGETRPGGLAVAERRCQKGEVADLTANVYR